MSKPTLEQLASENVDLARKIGWEYFKAYFYPQRDQYKLDIEDVLSIAYIGYMKGCRKYLSDYERLSQYAHSTVICRYVKNQLRMKLRALDKTQMRDGKCYSITKFLFDDDLEGDSLIPYEILEAFSCKDSSFVGIELEEAFSVLSPREKQIVFLYYYVGLTQVEIAEELNLSQAHISRTLSKADKKLKGAV